MRADRLLSILLLLQSRGRMTAAALAERLEVSERTIYRDLDALSAAGVPVYAERGARGGCVLRPGFRTDLTGLNTAEVASLFAGTAGPQLDALGLGAGLRGAMAKLEAALPGERRAEAERLRQRIHVDPLPWFEPREPARHLEALREAVIDERAVRLAVSRPGTRPAAREVNPLGLVVKGGIWYLVAVTRGEMRVYRVSRLHPVSVLRRRFERPARFDLAAFWESWARAFVRAIPEYWIKLRVPRAAIPILPRVFGERMRAALGAAGPPGRDGLLLDWSFDTFEDARGAVLGLGTMVEVVEPTELRAAVRDAAASVVRLYNEAARRDRGEIEQE
jgi:predicted DNA-binding transcriptional regulator YafY